LPAGSSRRLPGLGVGVAPRERIAQIAEQAESGSDRDHERSTGGNGGSGRGHAWTRGRLVGRRGPADERHGHGRCHGARIVRSFVVLWMWMMAAMMLPGAVPNQQTFDTS